MHAILNRRNAVILALLLLCVGTLVVFGTRRRPPAVVLVEPKYYTNAAGIVMAGVRIPSMFELPFKIPFIIDVGVSVFATAVIQTPSGTIEDQSVLKEFGVYFATAEVPTNRWRVRFESTMDRAITLGSFQFDLPTQTNTVTTSELPSRAEIRESGKLGPL